jgi:hypothetical protein
MKYYPSHLRGKFLEMYGFLIRKSFADLWDNIYVVILLNLCFLLMFALLFYLSLIMKANNFLSYIAMLISLIIIFIFSGGASGIAKDISDYRNPQFVDLFTHIKKSYLSSVFFALLSSVLFFPQNMILNFYGKLNSNISTPVLTLFLLFNMIWILSCQYFFPVQSNLDKRFMKIIKKMLLVFFDNFLFSILIFIIGLVIFIFSAALIFLLPGLSFVFLLWNVTLKTLLYKYEFLENHPNFNRKRIPWDTILTEEKEKLGKRKLKGLVFPWKE